MISRLAGGWQTTMADLALILFIVSVAGLKAGKESKPEPQPSPQGEAAAVYRASDDAPPVAQWLAEQAPDQRQHLTIVARYEPGHADAVARKALALAADAEQMGQSARIVIEPGGGEEVLAILAFDRPRDAVAQGLQGQWQD